MNDIKIKLALEFSISESDLEDGLAEYDEMKGIAWLWESADGANIEAPLAQESVGPNPTDRGKKWNKAKSPRRREWRPLITRRHRGKSAR